MSFVTRSPAPFGRGSAFSEAPFYRQCIHRSPSCCFPRSSLVSSPAELWAFQIPPHHAQVMALFLQSSPAPLLPSVRFLCAVSLGQEFSVHPCWPSAGPARLATHQMDPPRALRTLRLKTDQLSWTPLPSRATPMGYCLPESLNKPKPPFLKSRAVIVVHASLMAERTLDLHCSLVGSPASVSESTEGELLHHGRPVGSATQ